MTPIETALTVAAVAAWIACAPVTAYLSRGMVHEAMDQDGAAIPVAMVLVMFAPMWLLLVVIIRAAEAGARKGRP